MIFEFLAFGIRHFWIFFANISFFMFLDYFLPFQRQPVFSACLLKRVNQGTNPIYETHTEIPRHFHFSPIQFGIGAILNSIIYTYLSFLDTLKKLQIQ